MNICIVTVYNTENCGSFWQAAALAEVLKKEGHNVSFLHRPIEATAGRFRVHLHECVAKAAKLNFAGAVFVWKKSANFKKAVKTLNVIKTDDVEFENTDLFVIGSDTVWNFAYPHFYDYRKLYTGSALDPKRCITYAASASNTPAKMFENSEIREPIANLKAVGVRDAYTYDIVKNVIGREAKIVCDPTMLVEKRFFDEKASETKEKDYILLYHFDTIGEDAKREIIELKKKYGLKVISFGESRLWCDKSVENDPYDFLAYMKNASFVVTDTFHGTIFSIIFGKKFVEYGNRKKKVADLLEKFSLTHTVRENNNSTEDIFVADFDYDGVEKTLKNIRAESMLYLKENLTENSNEN